MKLTYALCTLFCGAVLAADYDKASETISNDFFVMSILDGDHLSPEEFDGFVAASKASIDYWQHLLDDNFYLKTDNRIRFTLDFNTFSNEKILGEARTAYTPITVPASKDQQANYYPLTNLANGVTFNVLHRSEVRLHTQFVLDDTSDFSITVNSAHDFYYGTGSSTGGLTDFHSVLLHEITHGMGFSSVLFTGTAKDGISLKQLRLDGNPAFESDGTPVRPISLYDTTILQNLENNDPTLLTLGGSYTLGDPSNGITLYNPATFAPGSSISHIDAATDPEAVMNFSIPKGVIKREFSDQELNFLETMGYIGFSTAGIPEPSSVALILLILPAAAMRRRRRA